MCYEIARVLGYECAKIELAKDESNTLGILNYLFLDITKTEHVDAISYLKQGSLTRPEFYTIKNIKQVLDSLDTNLFKDFLKIMVFDALVGEQDRHEENWGIEITNNKYKISPLYDNGCNLLREFKSEVFAEQFYSNKKDFASYINRSKTLIYKENIKTRYKHFELIEYLKKEYPILISKELKNLTKLTNKKIENIVNAIPKRLLTIKHKEYIINYLKRRRDILININETR